MMVKTDFEIKHFIEYMNLKHHIIEIIDKTSDKFYISKINKKDIYRIHEDALQNIILKCPNVPILNKIIQ